jgi:hypothetical protein
MNIDYEIVVAVGLGVFLGGILIDMFRGVVAYLFRRNRTVSGVRAASADQGMSKPLHVVGK